MTYSKTYLSSLTEDDGGPIYNFLSNKAEIYSAIKEEVDNLKNNNQKVDYAILLTNVGMDVEEYTSNEILSNLQNVDTVFDGQTHNAYNITTKDKTNRDIHITQTETKLANIGQLTIKQDGIILSENIGQVPET